MRSTRWLAIGLLIVAAASLGARAGAMHWLGDNLALGLDYYFGAALLLLAGCLYLRAWRLAVVAGLVLLFNGYQLAVYPRVAPSAAPAAEHDLRLMVYNIHYRNDDLAAVAELVRQYDPDVVFLMEYSGAIQQQIETSFAAYPHRLIRTSRFTMGLALFSRVPITATEIHRFAATRIPVFEVQLQLDGKSFTFVGGHPWPPQPQWGNLHRRQMQEITRVAAGAASPLIVAGDFNAAPWAYSVYRLASDAAVRVVRADFDLGKTWQPLPGVGLPLDHILVSNEWQVLDLQYGPPGGSDHVPLIIDLRLCPPVGAASESNNPAECGA